MSTSSSPGAAYTGAAQTLGITPPDSTKATLVSPPLASYNSVFAAVNTNYSPGQVPATVITPGYNGATAEAEITPSSTSTTATTHSSAAPLLSGTTLYAVIAGAGAAGLIIIIILSVWCWRRKKAKKAKAKWWKGRDDALVTGAREGRESEKPSTTGHSSDTFEEKGWQASPTSSIPEKSRDDFNHGSGVDSVRDELLGFGGGGRRGGGKGGRHEYQTDIYGHKIYTLQGSPESTADSTTLASSPNRQKEYYQDRPSIASPPQQRSYDSSSFNRNDRSNKSRNRYASIDESNSPESAPTRRDPYTRDNKYERSPSPAESIHFDDDGTGNYTDFMVRSPRRSSLSSEGGMSPLPSRNNNRKLSIRPNRKTDTILDFTEAYGYNRDEVRDEDEDGDEDNNNKNNDNSSWG